MVVVELSWKNGKIKGRMRYRGFVAARDSGEGKDGERREA
jgi:hypothetical protein